MLWCFAKQKNHIALGWDFFFCSGRRAYYIISLNQIKKKLQMMKKDEKRGEKMNEIQAFPVTKIKNKIKERKMKEDDLSAFLP
jgi:hypothetical protein